MGTPKGRYGDDIDRLTGLEDQQWSNLQDQIVKRAARSSGVHGGWMMSGTIVFAEGTDWTASSGIFNWVIDYLARTVDDEPTREALRVIDEQNFRWLNLADLSETGRREVLSKLADGIVTYSEEKLPETGRREDALATVGELAELARAILSNRK